MNRALGGSCMVPIGAWCVRDEHNLHLSGLVGDVGNGRVLRAEASTGDVGQADALGQRVADLLLAQGAGKLLGL